MDISFEKGLKFHDDECFKNGKGRELKAEDIKYCYTQLCTQSANNQGFTIFDGVVKGAIAFSDVKIISPLQKKQL